jgi:hypothetical protein
VDHVGLNVKADNDAAMACYRKLGFEVITPYGEFTVEQKSGSYVPGRIYLFRGRIEQVRHSITWPVRQKDGSWRESRSKRMGKAIEIEYSAGIS